MREDRYIACNLMDTGNHPIDARRHIFGGLSPGRSVAEYHPARVSSLDLGRRQSFVLTIIPFDEVRLDLGGTVEAREMAGLAGTRKRADEHRREAVRCQDGRQLCSEAPSVFGQRDVR